MLASTREARRPHADRQHEQQALFQDHLVDLLLEKLDDILDVPARDHREGDTDGLPAQFEVGAGEVGEDVQMRRSVMPLLETLEPLRSTSTTLLAKDSLTVSSVNQDVKALIAAATSAQAPNRVSRVEVSDFTECGAASRHPTSIEGNKTSAPLPLWF